MLVDDKSYRDSVHVQWVTYTPEATFQTVCNAERNAATILEQGGPEALAQWRSLEREMAPLQQGAATFPAAALRSDFGSFLLFSNYSAKIFKCTWISSCEGSQEASAATLLSFSPFVWLLTSTCC